jgi:hypothetical protein
MAHDVPMTANPSRRRVVALVASGLLAGGAVVGIVTQLGVASASNKPSPTARPYPGYGLPHARFGLPGRAGGRAGFGGPDGVFGPGLGGRVLHGQATVMTAKGNKVVSMQTGTVTTADGSQLSVKSSDGWVRSYVVNKTTRITLNGTAGTATTLKSGDTVRVVAVQTGSTWHAVEVADGKFMRPALPMAPVPAPPAAHG